jgi:hypothetical protein
MTLRLLVPAAALLLLASGARAGSEPKGQGRDERKLTVPADPALAPVLTEIEERMPELDAAAAAQIQVPARAIELGPRARMYRCWRLRLTGDHGNKVVRVFERLHSVQAAIRDQKSKLTKDLLLYSAASERSPELTEGIRLRNRSLGSLLQSYKQLLSLGKKSKMLKISERGLLSGRRSISPLLKEDDYTMVYDAEADDCKDGKSSP